MSYSHDSFLLGLAIKNACLCNLIFLLYLSVVEPSLVLRSEVFLWTYLQDKHSGKILHIFLTITKKQVRGEMEQPKNNCLITFKGLGWLFLATKTISCDKRQGCRKVKSAWKLFSATKNVPAKPSDLRRKKYLLKPKICLQNTVNHVISLKSACKIPKN